MAGTLLSKEWLTRLERTRRPELITVQQRAWQARALHQACRRGWPITTSRACLPGTAVIFQSGNFATPEVQVHPTTDLAFWLELHSLCRRLSSLERRLARG